MCAARFITFAGESINVGRLLPVAHLVEGVFCQDSKAWAKEMKDLLIEMKTEVDQAERDLRKRTWVQTED